MAFDRNAEEDLAYGHKPVLLDGCLTGLNIRPDGIYVDGTLGRAGHSLEIARRLSGGGRLICLDRDETAIAAARERLADYRDRVTLVHSNFSRLGEVLGELGIPGADGMLFDLGVSSPQLDDAARGFSYMHDAPLDMRMDRTAGLTATDAEKDYASVLAGAPLHSCRGECTYCGHCKPCPAQLDIAMINKFYDLAAMQPEVPATVRSHYELLEHTASACIGCRACETRCPFGVPVAERMRKTAALFGC